MDNFREWVSDNLRYIMLICAIVIVFLGIFFGVRAITGRMSGGNTDAGNTGDNTEVNAIPAEVIESGVALNDSTGTAEVNKIPEISGLVSTYYLALNNKNVESIRAISNKLTDQDVKDIENSETEYSDVQTYIKPGLEKDGASYVVYASYDYINPSLYVKHPGLSWLYVKKNNEGEYKIIVDAASDEKIAAYVSEISGEEDIKALVDEITKKAEKAEAEEQSAAESEGAAASLETKTEENNAAPESVKEEAPAESTESPAPEAEPEDGGDEEEEDTESEEGLGYNNEFPDDGASEHKAKIGSACNLRAGAGYNYKVITVLDPGTPITVIGELSKGWYHISCEAGDGYIGSKFVDFG